MAGTIAIKNGHVFDPLNEINGDKMDIFIRNGKVVTELSASELKDAKEIDASGKTVMPGGVDSHSHVAGAKVNVGRMMRPEDHYKFYQKKTPITHSGCGYSVPSVYLGGYEYSKMGYTTVFEAAVPPMEARHTHEEMRSTPMLDMGGYLVLGNNWFLMRYLKEGDMEKAAAYVAWMMKTHKTYGIKCVNPAGVENWGWGENVSALDQANIHFEVTPEDIIKGLTEINEMLGFPMPVHLHANNLGHPGCWEITRDSLKIPKPVKARPNTSVEWAETKVNPKRHESVYLTHCQFNAFGGTSWRDFESGVKGITDYVNNHEHVVMDSGCVPFGDATVMTGDGPAIHDLYVLTGHKWSNTDVECECGSGVLPFTYLKNNPVHSVQWAMGLEVLLYVDDPWKVIMTTDSPNGGPFIKYPQVIAWLMSNKARQDTFNECHKWAQDRTDLSAEAREMSLYDIATITRANSARTIGMSHSKGTLGIGADGDVAIYDIDPTKLEVSDYESIIRGFENAAYTIKEGQVVSQKGEIVAIPEKKTYYTDISTSADDEKNMLDDVKNWFKYYTIGFNNYPTPDKYLANPTPIKIDAEV
ncbi:formylmethanofuran dehydrogenase subunit A [Methanolobus halotolerans]|uniref:Formylmethanofuran dehydrogenase subunit A n=1 Tax=Methanolobus halotolerans TaxID=2052935 RepID=A0A4E0Q8Q8_9EURY|nr:formylmethanofuran dehydrogenase subunit A [Methanolobus halotolerans]TGC08336.1 formylmethanofuran dehydrogenase subunit A [Methanolobus halotolerans]